MPASSKNKGTQGLNTTIGMTFKVKVTVISMLLHEDLFLVIAFCTKVCLRNGYIYDIPTSHVYSVVDYN